MGKVRIGPKDNLEIAQTKTVIKQEPQIIEKIVEVDRFIEVKVPEYITIYKEIPIEKIVEVEKILEREKIVEIPKIQIVEKPYEVVREVYDVSKVIREKQLHEKTKRKLNVVFVALAFSLIINYFLVVSNG